MKLRTRMLLGAATLSLLSVVLTAAVVGSNSYEAANTALQAEASAKLTGLREQKSEQVKAYLESLAASVRVLAASTTVSDAFRGFRAAVPKIAQESGGDAQTAKFKAALTQYASGEFAPEFVKRNPQQAPDMAPVLGALDATTLAMQYHYITNNPQPLGKKEQLISSPDGTSYSKVHAQFHPSLEAAQKQFGYYDIFLYDAESKRIVYTVFKELDFASRLDAGIATNTKLAEVIGKAAAADKPDALFLSDYATYLPSYDDQAAFIAVPLFDGTRNIGALAVQVPLDRITTVMTSNSRWKQTGLGETGETFLVGADQLMRTDARQMIESKAGLLSKLAATLTGQQKAIAEKKGTTIGLVKVDTSGVRDALAGKTGVAQYIDYRGEQVFGAYSPLKVLGLNWAIVSKQDAAELLAPAAKLRDDTFRNAALTALAVLAVAGLAIFLFMRAFMRPINQLQGTVQAIAGGDLAARSKLATGDEIQDLGDAMDKLLDDRLDALAKAEAENEKLNNSVITLLGTMNDLSQRDLTVRAPVSDDVIGTVADSVNYLTESTSSALQEVSNVAGQVQTVSDNVRAQSQAVSGAVTDAQAELGSMTQILQRAAETLRGVAQLAEVSNKAAGQTSNASRAAQVAVNDTVQGMQAIREQIGEMEKRIKRLGERSQEISQVVGLINTISERTHVLALNASMQAAQAGEAGRGFAAVAEEVQRLADSVRQSTQQIASLVQNIQLETNDTVTTVNRVIDQVVKGSEAAQRSNVQMEITERSTSQLVQAVQRIATASQAQVKIAEALQVSVGDITRTTERTAEQVRAQNHSTSLLTEAAAKLVATVGEFRLPEQAA